MTREQQRLMALTKAGRCGLCRMSTRLLANGSAWLFHECKETRFLTARFNMTMRPEERDMLQALALDMGLNEARALRSVLRDAYAGRFGKRKPRPHVPKYNSHVGRELARVRQ